MNVIRKMTIVRDKPIRIIAESLKITHLMLFNMLLVDIISSCNCVLVMAGRSLDAMAIPSIYFQKEPEAPSIFFSSQAI